MPRRFVIAQFPNAPMLTTLAARAVARTADGDTARTAKAIADIALLVWSFEEIFDGANWFRRLLGVGGAAVALTPR
jgi:hypothetical protein